jgi:hypothetical protein
MTQQHKTLWLAVFAATFFALGTDVSAQAGAGVVRRGVQYMRGAARNAAASASPVAMAANSNNPLNMTYYGGRLLPNSTVYAMWWGKPSDFPADAQESIDDFLENLDGSAYLAIADQYMFGQKTHTHFGGNLFDSSAPPVQDVPTADIVAEVYKILTANRMKADPAALYAVYVSNFPNENYYCAYHDVTPAPDGTLIHVIYVPNSTFAPGCKTNGDPLFSPDRHSEATRAMANSTAHEIMESITDPDNDRYGIGWVNLTFGLEVADFCNFIFQTPVPLADSSKWRIQEIWSNEAGGCVQGAGRDVRVLGAVSRSGAITTFDIRASTYGTFSQSTNIFGAVTGYYTDATYEFHAFLRDSLGNIATVDPPGTGPGLSGGAQAVSINTEGAIVGNYGDINGRIHAFVRDNQGNFVTLDPTGATYAQANSINDTGVITGFYFDANGGHGFVRDTLGNIATFDAPVASPFAIVPVSINANGAVTGNYLDANFLTHGFVRHQDGTIATFDAPGASQGTFPQSINDSGTIAGYFTDAKFVTHGFVRDFPGPTTTFDDPNASSGTFALSINASGAVGGYYSDASGFPQSFVRDASGRFSGLSAAGNNFGTVVRSINAVGSTAGYETAATR